jgi:uncharacterized protein
LALEILKRKIALGTVQFGLPYGINNSTGKPNPDVISGILDYASNQGVHLLDSAEAYGDSLAAIGSYLKKKERKNFEIISKFIGDHDPIEHKLAETLKNLSIDHLFGYLYHRFEDYNSGKYQNALLALKDKNLIQRIGVSVYGIKELKRVVADPAVDMIQLAFNPFDATKEKQMILREAKSKGKEIHIRSVFLQGLFFKNPSELTGNLIPFERPLKEFQRRVREHDLNIREVCLNYALHQPFADHVIIGVDKLEHLQQNLSSILDVFPESLLEWEGYISEENTMLLNPSNWKP